MTAQPKPTAADVLREHRDVCGDGSLCDCGWQRQPRPGAATPGPGVYLRHVEDMLAAAGLLATAEHDAQVAAQALGDWADEVNARYPDDVFLPIDGGWRDQVREFCEDHGHTLDALSAHVMRFAAGMARADADRIAGEAAACGRGPCHRPGGHDGRCNPGGDRNAGGAT